MMRLLLPVFVAACIILAGCSDKDRVPGNVIPKEKMEKILWDIIQAERFSASFLVKDSTKNVKTETFKLYEQIFRLHKITRDEFVKSYKFYLSRPDIAKVMFDSLSTHANRSREELYRNPKADSTNLKADSAKLKADSAKAVIFKAADPKVKRLRGIKPQ
jgi:hypothetical protein